ncbi:probable protein phosphatase 2c 43 [Phtheirospermum japonicum]|uniref:protein-serine/threonine phosphatase n=1 Tax=Phtheirospermum japonicum TaxID=374723 RepID=A0A830BCN1_9LAMI|nr:probable protein phosphatase 2c 43 [Phtheirospermum japonicum]
MCSTLGRTVSSCFRPLSRYARMKKDEENDGLGGENDSLLWSRDLERHCRGEFSFAVVQANEIIEDHSQVETGRNATFVGIYDGHGGPEAARYICDHMFRHLLKLAQENGKISKDVIKNALSETENGFLSLVKRAYAIKPTIAAIGSCCLVGVIWKGTLYVANLGDSRAVLGYTDGSNKIVAEQLTKDHNASTEEVRKELKALHPEDSQILVSRSIGDAYLKRPEFALDSSFPRFHLPEPLRQPILRSDPAIFTRDLQQNDKFVIFASDGLWEHLTNQDAVEIVHNNPRSGIAKRLVITALERAAMTRQIPYSEVKKLEQGIRRHIHDDITVVVLFIDDEMMDNLNYGPELSVRGCVDTMGPSNFNI